jgi:hypothetical protein
LSQVPEQKLLFGHENEGTVKTIPNCVILNDWQSFVILILVVTEGLSVADELSFVKLVGLIAIKVVGSVKIESTQLSWFTRSLLLLQQDRSSQLPQQKF